MISLSRTISTDYWLNHSKCILGEFSISKEKLDVFTAPKSKVNMEEQIETLISAENDDAKQVTLFNYWQQSKKKKNFDAENFLEDLIAKNYAL